MSRRSPWLLAFSVVFLLHCSGTKVKDFGLEKGAPPPAELPKELKQFEVMTEDGEVIEDASVEEIRKREEEAAQKAEAEKEKSAAQVKPKKPRRKKRRAAKLRYPKRRPKEMPFHLGEKTVLNLTYFGMLGGTLELTVLPNKEVAGRQVYHIRGWARSSSVFSLFYRINDMAETYFDWESLFSHRLNIKIDESKQTRDSLELNDSKKKQTFYWNRWNHHKNGYSEVKQYAPISRFPQDSLSALFYLRTLPLKMGAVYQFPVVSEAKEWVGIVTVLKKERMKTIIGRLPTIKLQLDTQFKGVLQKKGDIFLWLSDDEHRMPVRLEAKVKIGRVIAAIKQFTPGKKGDSGLPKK